MNVSLLIFSLMLGSVAEAKALKYPSVISFYSDAKIMHHKETKLRKPKLKEILRETAQFETGAKGTLDIALDAERILTVLPNSRVSLSNITWETGMVSDVFIHSGEIYWQQKQKSEHPILLKSDLFELLAPTATFKIGYDPKLVQAKAKVFVGSMEFSAMNSENSVLLTSGQEVLFQGTREDGEVAYDILLKGRKIPKGNLSKVTSIPEAEMRSGDEIEKQRHLELKRKAAESAKKNVLLPGQICRNPGGKLNECVWLCENNPKTEKSRCLTERAGVVCVRKRCNANGDWDQRTELKAEAGKLGCQAKPIVRKCDY